MKRKVMLSLALTLLAFSSLVITSISFAWILTTYPFANLDNKPGEIDGLVTSKYWNKNSAQTNKWEEFNISQIPDQEIGQMDRIDLLPTDHFSYFVFNFNETTTANTTYFLIMESIEIFIESDSNDSGDELEEVSYYNSSPDQAAYYYRAARSTNPDLNPTTLFSGEGTQINSENQIISPTDLADDEYFYIMFYLELGKVQNIIHKIPLHFSPYTLGFEFTFNVEKRTIDEY